jgi:hypothetical protein
MMERLQARADAAGEAGVARVVARAAEGLAEVPGVTVEARDGRVEVSGRGLRRRLAGEAALRWIGGWLR